MNKIKVGYLWDSYPHKRNIIDIVEGVEYKKVFDYHKFLSYIAYIPKKLGFPNAENIFVDVKFGFNDFGLNNVDLLHFFNNVSYGKTPWISTFETFIPRFSPLLNHQTEGIPEQNKKIKRALKSLASDSCKKIIAISNCTENFEYHLLEKYPEFKERIEQKMVVVHPPQKIIVNSYEEKEIANTDELSFIMVGGDFFRKGGLEVLRVLKKLVDKKKVPIHLTIVSKLDANDYATKAGQKEIDEAVKIIENNSSWITYYKSLPNNEVLELMKSHQIGLLPTWADTYGYSVLELQASGCPVITTDIRALSEINSNERGWLIEVPKNQLGEALFSNENMRMNLSNSIMIQLEEIIMEMYENKEQIEIKSLNAIEYIREKHKPSTYATQLKYIYTEAIK